MSTCRAPRFVLLLFFSVAFVLLGAGPVLNAETGPALELLPWPNNAAAVFTQDARIFGDSHVKGGDDHFQMSTLSFDGRLRFSRAAVPAPFSLAGLTLGYAAQYFNLNTTAPDLPQHLVDASVAAGEVLLDSPQWKITFVGGAEYAGSTIGGDPDAYYGRADLLGAYRIDPRRTLIVGLDYDGNRLFLPDVPLPIFAYAWRVNPTLHLTFGLPYVAVIWRPWPRFKLLGTYAVPYSGRAAVYYRLFDKVQLLADYAQDQDAFHLAHAPATQRLFFSQQRVEAGLAWRPLKSFRLEVAGGYAFGQEFQTGFDVRKLTTVAEIAPAPYARVDLAFGF